MKKSKLQRNLILGILFFLPVAFLLMLYPSTHNYDPLEIVHTNIKEISTPENFQFKDHITVLAFFGKQPMQNVISASNLKELVYDKFKGFKKFQIVVVAPLSSKSEYDKLKKEIAKYEDLKFWHYVFVSEPELNAIYSSLKANQSLDKNLATEQVFIVDKDKNQRGRLDDREEHEVEKNKPIRKLYSYNCIEVSEIKNKMSDDMRILFAEYRQKRKGNFDSSTRRTNDLKQNNE